MSKVIIMLIIITNLPFDSEGVLECGLRQSARAKANRRTTRDLSFNSDVDSQLVHESDMEIDLEVDLQSSSNGSSDGQPFAAIVGGSYAVPGDFCWQCSLTLNGRAHCGATIINERYVLTAAHCLTGPGKIAVRTGSLFWYGGAVYPVTRTIIHPGYSANIMNDDIGLVELAQPLRYTSGTRNGNGAICSACLPVQGQEFTGNAIASGWGATREGGFKSDKMRWVKLALLRTDVCTKAYPHYKSNSELCAGYLTGGRDTCQGDSGGPLVKFAATNSNDNRQTEEKRAFVIGIVSNGNGCARAGYPGIYTKVSSYVNWIQNFTKKL